MTTKQVDTKKKKPTMIRSVMLTRFKLSQQKEKKENESHETKPEQLPKSQNILKQKISKTNKSPKKCKKGMGVQNVETAELHPNKLKRDKFLKKVLLKPNQKMIIIGRTNGSKRKINELKDEVKTSTPKRKKTSGKISSFISSLESNERSQSPVYSELGFEEIIRIAEENQTLSDEDLMEILTCPSPVWWEDPPDETFIEGPITLKSIKSIATPTVVPQRGKHSRKKTPHKIIIEPQIHKEDRTDFITIIDTKALNSKSKPDYKFNNKRSKLENLLSTIKNKLSEKKVDHVDKKESRMEPEKGVDVRNETEENKDNSVSLDEDMLPDISPLDNDCLEHLENMEIPIEKKPDLEAEQINLKIIETTSDAEGNEIKVLNENSKGNPLKNYPSLENKKKFKILKRSNVKRKRNMAKEIIPIIDDGKINKEKQELIDNKVYNSYTMKNKISPKTRHKLLKQTNKTDTYITDSDDNSSEGNITNSEFEEYMTVFKIVSSDEANPESETIDVKESTVVTKDKTENEAIVIENECTDKGKLNSYYKICKNAPKASKIIRDAPVTDQQSKPLEEEGYIDNELCDDCSERSAIVVHDTDDVKYCLKCSSIFDMEECNYCIRKEKQKQEEEARQNVVEGETNAD